MVQTSQNSKYLSPSNKSSTATEKLKMAQYGFPRVSNNKAISVMNANPVLNTVDNIPCGFQTFRSHKYMIKTVIPTTLKISSASSEVSFDFNTVSKSLHIPMYW